MLVLNFIFDLLWTGRGFSVRSVAFLGFRELKQIDKYSSVPNAMPSYTAKANGLTAGVLYAYHA